MLHYYMDQTKTTQLLISWWSSRTTTTKYVEGKLKDPYIQAFIKMHTHLIFLNFLYYFKFLLTLTY